MPITISNATFEEGTFTPTMTFATPGTSSFTYSSQVGHYQKIGTWVNVFIDLAATPTIGTAIGDVRIEGLPFAAGVNAQPGSLGNSDADITWPVGATQLVPLTTVSQTYLILKGEWTANNGANLQASGLTGGASNVIRLTIRYKV